MQFDTNEIIELKGVNFYFEEQNENGKRSTKEYVFDIEGKQSIEGLKIKEYYFQAFLLLQHFYNRNDITYISTSEHGKNFFLDADAKRKLPEIKFHLLLTQLLEAEGAGSIENEGLNILFDSNYDENHVSRSDLKIKFRNDGRIAIEYNACKIKEVYIEMFQRQLNGIVRSALDNPEIQIAEIPLIDSKMGAILESASYVKADYDFSKPLYELFENQAAITPEQTAYISFDENGKESRISYKSLDKKSSALAYLLQKKGVVAETAVGVFLQRSTASIVSLMGILKAGGIYLPLESESPSNYIENILLETTPKVIITDHVLRKKLNYGIEIIDIDDFPDQNENYDRRNSLKDTAIIMYTSGSTGKPKGVKHKQLQVLNRLYWMWENYPFQESDVMAQRTSVNYMPSMWEWLGGLLRGITTIVVSDPMEKDPHRFLEILDKYKISYLTVVPSLLKMMMVSEKKFRSLAKKVRVWTTCGEPFSYALYQCFQENLKNSVLINDHGATEVNGILYFDSGWSNGDKLPRNKTIPNVRIYILDENEKPVPIGVAGTIYVAGIVLSTGYVNNDLENQKRFLSRKTVNDDEVLFRLGDRAVYHMDGTIETLGRNDNQVKIRGTRIDLDGVERVLNSNSRIQQAAVVVKEQESGNKYLHAFVEVLEDSETEERIRSFMLKELPAAMVPTRFTLLHKLPKLKNGKVDRETLSKGIKMEQIDQKHVEDWLISYAKKALDINAEIDENKQFYELGFDSVNIVQFLGEINQNISGKVSISDIYNHATLRTLGEFIKNLDDIELPAEERLQKEEEPEEHSLKAPAEDDQKIAVIGMACRYAGADSKEELWNNLQKGVSSICEIPKERWSIPETYSGSEKMEHKTNSKWGGFINDIQSFDSSYFGITTSEAECMDTQQKVCLKEVYQAIEDAGYAISSLEGESIGVFLGARQGDYMDILKKKGEDLGAYAFMGTDMAILSARIAYLLNLKGPCMTIDTACSSSLTAIHTAVNSLKLDECHMAIAGGVFVMNTANLHIYSSQMDMLSPAGKCKTFDDSADGFVPGEGAGIVILKRLSQAIKDHDRIYGVIDGSGINQDGKTNGITAPNKESQHQLQTAVYEKYNIDPDTISYIEAHGTGTKLGDPIEVDALTAAFQKKTQRKHFCALGSIKTNIGHTVTASGVAGLIKILLSIQNKMIPPTLNYKKCNSFIDLSDSAFYVNDELREWEVLEGENRRAALSSFGFGGSNCHMVVSEYKERRQNPMLLSYYFMPISAKSKEAVIEKAKRLIEWLSLEYSIHIGDIAVTLNRIELYEYRICLIVENRMDFMEQLKKLLVNETDIKKIERKNKKSGMDMVPVISENDKSVLKQRKEYYLQGQETGLTDYYFSMGYRLVSLPPYPWNALDLRASDLFLQYKGNQHQLHKEEMIAGAVYIDVIFRYYERKTGDRIRSLSNICWMSPLKQTEDGSIQLELSQDNEISVKAITNKKDQLLASAYLNETSVPEMDGIKVMKVMNEAKMHITAKECYERLLSIGLYYGPSYSLIEEVFYDDIVCLARIKTDEARGDFLANPFILDAAFQSVVVLLDLEEEKENVFLPFSVQELVLRENLEHARYIYAHKTDTEKGSILQKFDLEILDEHGTSICTIKEFTRRKMQTDQVLYYKPYWEEDIEYRHTDEPDGHLLIFGERTLIKNYEEVAQRYGGNIIEVSQAEFYEGKEFKHLFQNLQERKIKIYRIIHLWQFHKERKNDGMEQALEHSILFFTDLIRSYLTYYPYQETKITVFYETHSQSAKFYDSLYSAFRAFHKEQPQLLLNTVGIENMDISTCVYDHLSFQQLMESTIYKNGVRYCKKYQNVKSDNKSPICVKESGIYIITGGAGGIGKRLIPYLSRNDTTLILVGRSEVSDTFIEELKTRAGRVEYVLLDITRKDDVKSFVDTVYERYGNINGLFHCAGVLEDALLARCTRERIERILKPKIYGFEYFVEAIGGRKLDFVLNFSSIAAVAGNQGQSIYAYANGYLDACAEREQSYPILSIDWALWENGTMGNHPDIRNKLKKEFQMLPISDEEAISAIDHVINRKERNIVVTKGEKAAMDKLMTAALYDKANKNVYMKKAETMEKRNNIEKRLEAIAKQTLGNEELQMDQPFDSVDADSISLMEFTRKANKEFKANVTTAKLFEYNTLRLLSEYLKTTILPEEKVDIPETKAPLPVTEPQMVKTIENPDDIAIIGMSGRFPGAENIETFWENICHGNTSITEVTDHRWNTKDFRSEGREYLSYGGAIEDIEKFDPLFFNITPKEAEMMDPQQRILLEESLFCLEDAGYSMQKISGKKVGVYIGAFSNDYYQIICRHGDAADPNIVTGTDSAMLANRISYFYNLNGPSEVINTACSSSLVSIYRAMKAIRSGECTMAFAGGVNAVLNPVGSLRLGSLGFLCKDGKTKSYDTNADGYVRGEGAGLVLLKSLKKAKEDGDQIYAVLKGGAVNHGGSSHYIMDPNPIAQAEVIKEACRDASTDMEDISYIEAHGTGTKVGDMNETYAFSKAFRDTKGVSRREKGMLCRIGTVKPNIGHLEAASGMASFIKACFALKNGKIPPSLNCGQTDETYELKENGLIVNTSLQDWEQQKTWNGDVVPRKCGVHAYGYGGTNAHLILEEYVQKKNLKNLPEYDGWGLYLFSAKTKESLQNYLHEFASFIEKTDENDLSKVESMLKNGRTTFHIRLAIFADSKNSLQKTIADYIDEKADHKILSGGDVAQTELVKKIYSDADDYYIKYLFEKKHHEKIALLWVNGIDIDWNMEGKSEADKIRIPSYCLQKETYWYDQRPIEQNKVVKHGDDREKLLVTMSHCMGVSKELIENSTNLLSIGMHSIVLAKLKFEFEKEWDIKVALRELADKKNFAEVYEYIIQLKKEDEDWLKDLSDSELDKLYESMKE